MSARSSSRPLAAIILVTVLIMPWSADAAPGAGAGPRPPGMGSPAPASLVVRAWGLLTALWQEAGCIIDPHGCAQDSGSHLDEGCGIDPHGGCAPDPGTSSLDAGCGLDPHGLCSPAAAAPIEGDEGCILDPHGCQ